MQDIADWLGKLGLEQYARRFAENDIEVSVLPYLTDQDFEKIGMSLGHRRKILAAIAQFAHVAPAAPQPTLTEPKPQEAAERRQLTIMFCDLVGSTSLSAHMDPEDLREVISAYQAASANMIQTYDGLVAKFMGDGILAYYGYPRAHEDDAERAVRAGLDVIRVVSGLKTQSPESLQVRIGIATGLVVVGELIGSGERL
jgi:class 3 adenylate cyclase